MISLRGKTNTDAIVHMFFRCPETGEVLVVSSEPIDNGDGSYSFFVQNIEGEK